jgi:hypothetical protein
MSRKKILLVTLVVIVAGIVAFAAIENGNLGLSSISKKPSLYSVLENLKFAPSAHVVAKISFKAEPDVESVLNYDIYYTTSPKIALMMKGQMQNLNYLENYTYQLYYINHVVYYCFDNDCYRRTVKYSQYYDVSEIYSNMKKELEEYKEIFSKITAIEEYEVGNLKVYKFYLNTSQLLKLRLMLFQNYLPSNVQLPETNNPQRYKLEQNITLAVDKNTNELRELNTTIVFMDTDTGEKIMMLDMQAHVEPMGSSQVINTIKNELNKLLASANASENF